ncbi:hypothetical protein FB446DRAFT_795321 [Lentinula raphanica]|nr:hypothetical protein FB446DRAFT_795321 [Lentinula raphanica]
MTTKKSHIRRHVEEASTAFDACFISCREEVARQPSSTDFGTRKPASQWSSCPSLSVLWRFFGGPTCCFVGLIASTYCFQAFTSTSEKVRLVNYPADLKPIGPKDGLSGSALIPVHHFKRIVKQHIQFWQQEAKEKFPATRERDVASLFDDDDDEDGGNGSSRHKVFLEDLLRFVPWDDDEKQFSLKSQANIAILLQEPKGNEEPLPLTRVLHSKVFLKRAAARQIKINLPKEMQGDSDESDQAKTSGGEQDDSGSDGDSDIKVRPKKSRKVPQSRAADSDSDAEKRIPPLHKSRHNAASGSRGEPKPKNKKRTQQHWTGDSDSDAEVVVPARRYKHLPRREQQNSDASDEDNGNIQKRLGHEKTKVDDRRYLKERGTKNRGHSKERPRPHMIPPGGVRTVTKVPVAPSNEADESSEERPYKRAQIEKKDESRKRKRDV